MRILQKCTLFLRLEGCVGDANTWNAGFGSCDTYATGLKNHAFCLTDCVDGQCASQVCHECESCAQGTFKWTLHKTDKTDYKTYCCLFNFNHNISIVIYFFLE